MEYLRCEVKQEKRWLEDPMLIVTIHFSPEMLAIIDSDFLYEEALLRLAHGTWLVRHWLYLPGVQIAPAVRHLCYAKGTTAEKTQQWCADYGVAGEQLEVFRWKLIKKQRGIPDRPALPQPVLQEILEPVKLYNGEFGAKGY